MTTRGVLRRGDGGGPLRPAAICSVLIRGLPAAAFERSSNVSPAHSGALRRAQDVYTQIRAVYLNKICLKSPKELLVAQ